ncbi:FolC bifunctional protein [Durotheca rogersii]|uniref:FolC bifunctional protein n=1 Tax=Durotheca rogersii TaxID=419775 RepID=UPI00222103DA|nr:FolC bifunctional protein [Durotheca rogersii]KAI5862986.1 FolC bifunctional protein [Durotheca rogersii]
MVVPAVVPRTYESALKHLDSIQSNRAVTSLFTPRPAYLDNAGAGPSSPGPSIEDVNTVAIPEMLAWLRRAGLTTDELAAHLRCIHVAGTKGKGSVCAYLTSILVAEGAAAAGRVGTYTSPHLVSVRERIAIDGRPLSRDLFTRYFFEVWDALTESARAETTAAGASATDEELAGPATKPFYFRFVTLVALHAFLREGVRSAVVECGIGGEYDSTNVLPAAAVTTTVVTQLGVDHEGMLGSTLPDIAWHKSGVCKSGRRCFTRSLSGRADALEAMRVLRRRAADKGATLFELSDAEVETWGGVRGREPGNFEGAFQKYNQALALRAAAEHLWVLSREEERGERPAVAVPEGGPQREGSLTALEARFGDGVRAARLRGRCETKADGRLAWHIDGAHTEDSLAEAATWFVEKRRALAVGARATETKTKTVLLFNQQDRDVVRLLTALLAGLKSEDDGEGGKPSPVFDVAVFTRNELAPRGDPDLAVQRAAAHAMRRLSPPTATLVADNVQDAVARIRALAAPGPDADADAEVVVLATGSLHLVGALLRALEPEAEL